MAIDASALREAQRQQALIAAFEVAGDAAPTDLPALVVLLGEADHAATLMARQIASGAAVLTAA